MADQRICDRDDSLRATAALVEQFVVRSGVRRRVFVDALRVGVPEAVDRLVFIADHRHRGISADRVDQRLIGLVEILILVHQNVLIDRNVGMPRILQNEIQRELPSRSREALFVRMSAVVRNVTNNPRSSRAKLDC